MVDISDVFNSGESIRNLISKASDLTSEDTLDLKLMNQDLPKVSSYIDTAIEKFSNRSNDIDKPIPLPWKSIENILGGGLWPGLGVIIGASGSGKTQMALQMALHAAMSDTPVLYVGLELDPDQIVARLLGIITRHQWSNLYFGINSKDIFESELLKTATSLLKRLPLHCEFASPSKGWSMDSLFEKCKLLQDLYKKELSLINKKSNNQILIIVDFLQLVTGEIDVREKIRKSAYIGRELAKDFSASVLLISSTSREHYWKLNSENNNNKYQQIIPGKTNPSYFLGMGKESGDIEYAADWQVTIVQNEIEKTKKNLTSNTWLAFGKIRTNKPSWAELIFDGNCFLEPKSVTRSIVL